MLSVIVKLSKHTCFLSESMHLVFTSSAVLPDRYILYSDEYRDIVTYLIDNDEIVTLEDIKTYDSDDFISKTVIHIKPRRSQSYASDQYAHDHYRTGHWKYSDANRTRHKMEFTPISSLVMSGLRLNISWQYWHDTKRYHRTFGRAVPF